MKKIIFLFILFFSVLLCNFTMCYAADGPIYDATFNNNQGAFFANGTDITIDINDDNNTIISWQDGNQIVPPTVTVFGGGNEGTSYESSNITMNSGEVTRIVGGGLSTNSESIAKVENSNITINGGIVSLGISGGGFLYAEVTNANVTVNNGTIGDIEGGGFASVSINGIWYSVGTEENPQNSENRTENANIIINGGSIIFKDSDYGLVFGGGQGYSYVGTSNITINGGDLSKAYLTAGGSNGYTEESNVKINDGNIMVYQSVNRGIVEDANLVVSGGTIDNLYVGGETTDSTVTGIINNADISLIAGTVNTLEAGKSNSQVITIDNDDYVVAKTEDVEIINDNIPSGEIEISYDISIEPEEIAINKGESANLIANVVTIPSRL